MSMVTFDLEGLVRGVRAAAGLPDHPATSANLLRERRDAGLSRPATPANPLQNELAERGPHGQNSRNLREAAERAASIPRGYTELELEEARRDAQRLGYGLNRKLH
jgi:hypothetical protein